MRRQHDCEVYERRKVGRVMSGQTLLVEFVAYQFEWVGGWGIGRVQRVNCGNELRVSALFSLNG